MQRIVIMGGPGSGKSTLARRLGDKLGLKVVHLDALNFDPGWVEAPTALFRNRVEQALAGERWVVEGNYTGKTLDLKLPRADAVLWLDQSRLKRFWRVIARTLAHRGRIRPDMAEGCPERVNLEFLNYAWSFDRDKRALMLERIRAARPDLPITLLSGDHEVVVFLQAVELNRKSESLGCHLPKD